MRTLAFAAKHAFLAIAVFIVVVPLYSVLLNSFRGTRDIAQAPFRFSNLTLDNFAHVFGSQNDIFRMYGNSLTITGISLICILVIAPMAGYYIARSGTRLAPFLMVFFLVGIMLPDEVTIIPLVTMYVKLEWIGKLFGMIVFYVGSKLAVSIFLYKQFIATVPYELEESAIIDGAGQLRTFWGIVYPLLLPVTATLVVFVGMHIWNDFLMPLYLLQGVHSRTITVGIFSAIGDYSENWGHVFAWVVAASAPILVLFLLAQRFFIEGLTAGAIKG
ncbi:carbohydrate ABC transporter permease [Paenibacillus sp.]|uniref:carbohydrate ABC transporter permease n=1 Tax=Paenibacillus sp. TaxID=58172 RepID=UPI002D371782|nr:carbohydrate ABC transporter permease [Paenibacillus sp.]HZG55559.1 carbohydrate ABC transporter permease [Paenibacillus sp.]